MPWPIVGMFLWLRHPRLWGLSLVSSLLGLLACVLIASLAGWLAWPGETEALAWYEWLYRAPLSVAAFLAVLLACWAFVAPLIWGYFGDILCGSVYKQRGIEAHGESTVQGVRNGIAFIWHSKYWRLGWPILTFISGFIPLPIAPFIAAWGAGHMLCMDAWDVAMARREISAAERYYLKETIISAV